MTIRGEMTTHYSRVAIAFHWTIAAMVVANLVVGIGHDYIRSLGAWMPAHKALGLTVMVLTAGRIAWRLGHRPPPLPVMPAWQKGLAHATHWSLYLLLLLMPLTGWVMVSGPEGRRALTWFGAFDLPYLPVSEAASGVGANGHGLLGWLMTGLVVLHVAAALYHQFVRRDGVLGRMLPATSVTRS